MARHSNPGKARRIPRLGSHSTGQARATIAGETYYCGRWGSVEAYAELPSKVGPRPHNDILFACARNSTSPSEPMRRS